jgi:hypothetical protein
MADRGEAHAVEEADCLWHPVSFERWPAWLEVRLGVMRKKTTSGFFDGVL